MALPELELAAVEEKPAPVRKGRRTSAFWLGLPIAVIGVLVFVLPFTGLLPEKGQNLDATRQPPAWLTGGSWAHPIGTDKLGQDLLTQFVSAGRITILIGLVGAVVAIGPGTLLGLLAGYYRGWVDRLISILIDAQLALPFILIALAIISNRGSSLPVLFLVLALTGWAVCARVTRSATLAIRERQFVLGLRAAGASEARIVFRHVLPNLAGTIVALGTLQVGTAILIESALSFLGLGVVPPMVSWGSMLAAGQDELSSAWWMAFFPGLAITVLVLLVNLLGDALLTHHDPEEEAPMTDLLSVTGLSITAQVGHDELTLLDDVDLEIRKGQIVGVVGESGSGKTTLARSVIGLLERNVRVTAGSISLSGDEVVAPGVDRTARVRGSEVGMVFQDASRSLNPLMKVRHHLAEVLRRHVPAISKADVERRSVEVLEQMRISDATRVLDSYPHQLSGGLRQRVAIGLAVVTRPSLVIADECTTALDVTTQTKVVGLFRTLVDELGIGLLFVTHDLMLASDLCDRIAVMSGGRVVEQGETMHVLDRPEQEYTKRLLAAIPSWS